MEPINWFITVVTQHYFDFNGRARRAEYWWYALANIVISVILGAVQSLLGIGQLPTNLLSLALLLPSLGVAVRRMHDIDRSGWWILAPFYNIYLLAQPGSVGTNQYGPDPKAATAVATV
jgi:uncharacterized membrane protein YhaH (DUF805 family)